MPSYRSPSRIHPARRQQSEWRGQYCRRRQFPLYRSQFGSRSAPYPAPTSKSSARTNLGCLQHRRPAQQDSRNLTAEHTIKGPLPGIFACCDLCHRRHPGCPFHPRGVLGLPAWAALIGKDVIVFGCSSEAPRQSNDGGSFRYLRQPEVGVLRRLYYPRAAWRGEAAAPHRAGSKSNGPRQARPSHVAFLLLRDVSRGDQSPPHRK